MVNLPRSSQRAVTKSSRNKRSAKRNSKLLPKRMVVLGIVFAIIVLIGGSIVYSELIPRTPKQVVVIIPEGAGENLHVGFEPAKITIVIGVNNTVVWKNEDNDWHTVHSNIPEFNSGLLQSGASFTHVFQRAGTFPYHCDPHPWMTGLVVVEPSSSVGVIQGSLTFDIPTLFELLDCASEDL